MLARGFAGPRGMRAMRIEGVPASAGYAEGPLFDLDRPPAVYAGKATTAEEKTSLQAAISKAVNRLGAMVESVDSDAAGILEFHIAMLEDDALSGPAFAANFKKSQTHLDWTAKKIAASETPEAQEAIARWMERLGRALAAVVNILDPDVIVLGGGLSNIESLYRDLPSLVERHAFTPEGPPRVVKNIHGDSSGVRGAAWLWNI